MSPPATIIGKASIADTCNRSTMGPTLPTVE
jgi:hypothetical protein